MADTSTWFQGRISLRAFLHGLAVAAGVYILIILFLYIRKDTTLEMLQTKLASHTATLEQEFIPPPAVQMAENGTEAAPENGSLTRDDLAAPPETPAPVAPVQSEPAAPAIEATQGVSALPPAPIAGFHEPGPYGVLPKKSPDGIMPFEAYKRPFTDSGRPKIAVLVLNYGISETVSTEALAALPADITFALSPYSEAAVEWQKKARAGGHEIWMRLPFETRNFPGEDQGPKALLTLSTLAENQDRMMWNLGKASGYAGVATDMDNTFMQVRPMLYTLLQSIYARGLGYLELNPSGIALPRDLAAEGAAPYVRSAIRTPSLDAETMTLAEEHARHAGRTLVVLEATPVNIASLKAWAESLPGKEISLAPVSAITEIPAKE